MPPLPTAPAPRGADIGAQPLPATTTVRARFAVDVPRYFIEVNVPGYSVQKTVALARRQKQQRQQDAGAGLLQPNPKTGGQHDTDR